MSTVGYEVVDGVAVVTVDNPPVNALGLAVRQGIARAVTESEADAAVKVVVLIAAGRTFMAGADVREFGKPPVQPHLPDVILMIQNVMLRNI